MSVNNSPTGEPFVCLMRSASFTLTDPAELQHEMADDDRRRNAEQTRSPAGEHGGLPCKEHDCPRQQQVEEQGIEDPYQWILQQHQGWRSHHRNPLCKSVQLIAVLDINLQVDPKYN